LYVVIIKHSVDCVNTLDRNLYRVYTFNNRDDKHPRRNIMNILKYNDEQLHMRSYKLRMIDIAHLAQLEIWALAELVRPNRTGNLKSQIVRDALDHYFEIKANEREEKSQ